MPRPGWDFPTNEEMREFFGKLNPLPPLKRDIGRIAKALKPPMGEPGWEKCICRWDLGMGPNINCPVHGRPELRRR